MTTFLRLLADKDKQSALASAIRTRGENVFEVDPASFCQVPGAPFSYWVSDAIRLTFKRFPAFEGGQRAVRQGMATADDFRFVRAWWEITPDGSKWLGFAKGGAFSRFYADLSVVVNWERDGAQICNFFDPKTGKLNSRPQNIDYFGQAGLTWPLRGITFSCQAVPAGCAFSIAGKMAFAPVDELETWLAVFNSRPFDYLVRLFAGKVGGVQYEAGLIGGIPVTTMSDDQALQLSRLARRGWSLKRTLASTEEKSHAFLLPAALRSRLGDFEPQAIEAELASIQAQIDDISFSLYGFSESDRTAVLGGKVSLDSEELAETLTDEESEDETDQDVDVTAGLLSWAVGVAFGRFDWRLATGMCEIPAEPNPIDPLPTKSPGMLPDGAMPLHTNARILVDDQGHPHDLVRLIEEVLSHVQIDVPDDVRRWLQRDFFAFHMQRYSKSRRKAPIYWPLATASGSYTLWVFYPNLSNQTLYKAINDFVEPKLKQVDADLTALRNMGAARSRDDEKQFETLQTFELELIELRDTLLKLAPTYKPNQDDGVQISAAPLWSLFRHKPWQKVLRDTWGKLEKGDYDWAHLAMNYWPERARENCRSDKSLAIAHGLEDLYEEPEGKPKKARGRKMAGGDE
ncbi:type II restriction endonuclease subunit M [Caballeronia sordidicola]|uniref:Putative type II restriction enzyme methylase subunit n=1 Tax=Caballeronia sordidicola TaxID=196367 RepID=A0A242MEZ6_CABSO|nr:type II restriction endonuclease subunit M [Caballeronia sordidicola]OTP69757.1 putative type II restriction enzyme methylase subunit [Caballeronia sordidicola]